MKTFNPGMLDINVFWSKKRIRELQRKYLRSKRREGREEGRFGNINREKEGNGASCNYFYKKGS